jgi:hypothetical protein
MASESKVQRVARQRVAPTSIGRCNCGGDLMWAQVVIHRPRMLKVCERCGNIDSGYR